MVTWQNGQGRIADVSGGILQRLFESGSDAYFSNCVPLALSVSKGRNSAHNSSS
jgi:hypothetical protein